LNYAVYQNLLPLVRIQAFLGADLNSRWVFDETPLMTAARESRAAIFQFLLEAGANINVRTTSFYGETVLHCAARDGCETCVNLLIEKN
ncbi:ankyrin repeat domain-containing protein, partial [Escherichia coli]|nr:ankyrin repeat domain-containing protein [Escherichia coli]